MGKNTKTGLILEDGGMRAGFVAGALMALMDKEFIDFDYAIGISASVPSLAYFAAGQRKEIESIWRDELSTPRLLCYENIPTTFLSASPKRPILDIDYLVYEVFKKKYPVDVSAILRNKMICKFGVTEVKKAELDYLTPGDKDIYETMKAALAVPGCYPRTVCLDGCEYVDGGTVNLLPLEALQKIEDLDKIVCILSRPPNCDAEPPTLLNRVLLWRYFRKYDWMLNKIYEATHKYNEKIDLLKRLANAETGGTFIIFPDELPPVKFLSRDHSKINRTIDLGYRKVEKIQKEIAGFI